MRTTIKLLLMLNFSINVVRPIEYVHADDTGTLLLCDQKG